MTVRIPTEEPMLGAVRFAGEANWLPCRCELEPDRSSLRLTTAINASATGTKAVALLPTEQGVVAAPFEVPANSTVPRLIGPAVPVPGIDVTTPPHATLSAPGTASAGPRLEVHEVGLVGAERNALSLDLGRRRRAEELGVLQVGASERSQHLLVEHVHSERHGRDGLLAQYRLADPDPAHVRSLGEMAIRLVSTGSAQLRRQAAEERGS